MNSQWNISGLIIEGICGTGKTTLLHTLLQSDPFVQRSFPSTIVLSEHQTQRVLERKEKEQGLSLADNTSLLDQHVSYLEFVHDRLEQMPWCANERTNMRISYVFERFHLTHVYHYSHMSWQDVEDIDARLVKLNCKVCLLCLDQEALAQRIITSRSSEWREYLKRYGNTDDEILLHYTAQQEELLSLSEKSKLESLVVKTSEVTVTDAVQQVLDFWGAV